MLAILWVQIFARHIWVDGTKGWFEKLPHVNQSVDLRVVIMIDGIGRWRFGCGALRRVGLRLCHDGSLLVEAAWPTFHEMWAEG